jgi:chorismate mutase
MAKAKKFPKAPKAKASLETWQKYDKKVAEVKKFNNQLVSDDKKKKAVIEKVKKAKASK